MAVLQQIDNAERGPLHQLQGDCVVIGRDDHCDLRIVSPAVSRFHAKITFEDSRYYVIDTDSRNGTSLNGRRIVGRELLNDGDKIDFSTKQFIFYSQLNLDDPTNSSGSSVSGPREAADLGDADDQSVRHERVRPGDHLLNGDTSGGVFQENKVVARLPVSTSQLQPLASQDATRKLLQGIRLMHSLRQMVRRDDVLSVSLEQLFLYFPVAERIAVVTASADQTEFQVLAAGGRAAEDNVELCLPLIQSAFQTSSAVLYVDQWRLNPAEQPRLSGMSTRYVMCAPLLHSDESPFGVIQIESGRTERPLDGADLERLVILCHIISFALDRTDLSGTNVAI